MKRYHSPKEYLDAATSHNTASQELQELAASDYDFVRLAVANNPNVTSEILESLIPTNLEPYNEQHLAAVLAKSRKTPAAALSLLAERLIPVMNNGRGNDYAFEAGVGICCNPNTPLEAISRILNYSKVATRIRKAIARETQREDVLELLALDRSEVVRKRAQTSLEGLRGKIKETL